MDRCFVFLSMRATYREATQTATGSRREADGSQRMRTPSALARRGTPGESVSIFNAPHFTSFWVFVFANEVDIIGRSSTRTG